MRKLILLSLVTLGCLKQTNAQVSISTTATPYTQNFDSLSHDTAAAPQVMNLNGWAIYEKGTSAVADQKYKVSFGTSTAGDVYSYGDTVATDRALGSLGSGSNKSMFGVIFQNNTGANLTDLDISFTEEQWRSGNTSLTIIDSSIFEYSTSADSINDTSAVWAPLAALNLSTLNLTMATAGALNGNLAANKASKTGSISVLIPNNGKIVLRWRDINGTSSDDGLAIDDLSITFASTGNPKPNIIGLTPADDATGLMPGTVAATVTFDQPVTVGTGNVTINNLTDATQQIIACATTTIAGAVVTIPGVTLLSGKNYAINFDSTCYHSSTNANVLGIYDNTTWNFDTNPAGLNDYSKNNLSLQLLGNSILTFNMEQSETLTVSIIDMNGKVVSQQAVNAHSGENKITLQNETLSHGAYFIRVSNDKNRGVLKFIK